MTSVFPLLLSNWLNLSVYDRNIFGFSSVVFGNLRKIFGSVRVMSGNVRLTFGKILENLRKSSESDRNSSEIRQIRRHQHVYIIKRTLHVSSNFMFSWQELNSSCHSNIISDDAIFDEFPKSSEGQTNVSGYFPNISKDFSKIAEDDRRKFEDVLIVHR